MKKRRARCGKFKRWLIAATVLSLIVAVCFLCRANLNDYIDRYAQTHIRSRLVDAVNDGTSEALAKKEVYGDYQTFVTVDKDQQGNIILIRTNMLMANLFECDVLEYIQSNVNELCRNETIPIPYGALTGSTILTQATPSFDLKLLPTGSVDCDFKSKFESVGINQTLHTLYLTIDVGVRIMMPVNHREVRLSTSMIVVQNLIVGKIPDVYLQNGGINVDLTP